MSDMADWQLIPPEDLLPHAPPMVLLDRVVAYEGQRLEAEVTITENSMFFDQAIKGVPAWVCIEYMAQAIAALGGLQAREKHTGPRIGYLTGTRKLLLHDKVLFTGQTYRVLVQQVFQDEAGLANFASTLLCGQRLCAEAAVNVFVPPSHHANTVVANTGVDTP